MIVEERALRGPNLYAPRPLWLIVLEAGPAGALNVPAGIDADPRDLGHLVGSTAVALQRAAGIPVEGFEARQGPEGWVVVYDLGHGPAAREAGRQAVRLVSAGGADVDAAIDAVRAAQATDSPGGSVQALLGAAAARGIPVMRRTPHHHQLGWGVHQQHLWNTVPGALSALGQDIAEDAQRTLEVLRGSGIPVADGADCRTVEDGHRLLERIGLPVVATPPGGEAGLVTTADALAGLLAAPGWTFVRQHVAGEPHRVLVVGDDVVGAVLLRDGADVTDTLHPSTALACRRAARLAGLDVVAVDLVAPGLSAPLTATGGRLVALRLDPPLGPFLERGAAERIVARMFPDGDGRIPLVAVTGTNGKTTTVRLIAHLLKYAGARVGMAVTGALEVANQVVLRGDWSGPAAARTVLREPGVTHAVCEVARGGILRSGLGFDMCDVAVLLNISGDHLGQGGIHTLEDLARLKGTVLRATRPGGTVVLNADDPLVWAMRTAVARTVVPFTMDPDHPGVQEHLAADPAHIAVTVQDGAIVVRGAEVSSRGPPVVGIPLTLEGAALFNVQNVLAATAVACASGLDEPAIWAGLVTFNPSMNQVPGRMNLLHIGGVKVLVDYGHNVAALQALAPVLPRLTTGRKINVACATGNRRDEDLHAFGATIAGMYDRIYLTDADPRGRAPGETPRLVMAGLRDAGFPEDDVVVVADEPTARRRALAASRPGDLVVLQVDDVEGTLRFCRDLQGRIEAGESAAGLMRALDPV